MASEKRSGRFDTCAENKVLSSFLYFNTPLCGAVQKVIFRAILWRRIRALQLLGIVGVVERVGCEYFDFDLMIRCQLFHNVLGFLVT